MNKKVKNILEKKNKTKIVSLTAYSKNIAQILDKHCDIILVGDSVANVLYGFKNTHQINLDNIIQHTQSVKKGIKKSMLVVDMPEGTYKNKQEAKKNAKLIMNLTKCDGVKLENNGKNFNIVKELNQKEGVSILLAEQNTNIALKNSDYGYIIETGKVMLEGTAESLLNNDKVKELYLGISKKGRKNFRDVLKEESLNKKIN